jgi:hypothetical protein
MKPYLQLRTSHCKKLPDFAPAIIEAFHDHRHALKFRQTIAMVCGPVTADGPEHINRNLEILDRLAVLAGERLGMSAFSCAHVFTPEVLVKIESIRYTDQEWFDHWRQVLRSRHVAPTIFHPGWERSSGTRDEHACATELGLPMLHITDFDLDTGMVEFAEKIAA